MHTTKKMFTLLALVVIFGLCLVLKLSAQGILGTNREIFVEATGVDPTDSCTYTATAVSGKLRWDNDYHTTTGYSGGTESFCGVSKTKFGFNSIDSKGPPGPTLAWGLYKIEFTCKGPHAYSKTFYLDLRDANFKINYRDWEIRYVVLPGESTGVVKYYSEESGWQLVPSPPSTLKVWDVFKSSPKQILFHIPVTVQTNFSGGTVKVGGTIYNSPYESDDYFLYDSFQISVDSPQYGNDGKKYTFSNWSDGGTQTHTVTITSLDYARTYTANFTTLTATMSGPSYLDPYEVGTFTANPSGGVTPYDYTWYRMEGGGPEPLSGSIEPLGPPSGVWIHLSQFDGSRTATSSGVYPGFKMRVDVKDNEGYVVTVEKTVSVGTGGLKKQFAKENSDRTTPTEFALFPNYPNPFNPTTKISYSLAEESKVTLSVYNVLGEKVKSLVNDLQAVGRYSVFWDGKDENGKSMPGGVYIYRIEAVSISGEKIFTAIGKMVLMK